MDVLNNLSRPDIVDWRTALISITLAFALAQAVAFVYMRTFRGLSYSRTLVQGMALASIVTCMLMLAIGNSIAAGIGIAGGLSIIRFRTTMRDPRDMVFTFLLPLPLASHRGSKRTPQLLRARLSSLSQPSHSTLPHLGHADTLTDCAIFCATRRGRPNSDRCASQSTLRLFRFGNTARSRSRQTHGTRLSDQCSQPRRP